MENSESQFRSAGCEIPEITKISDLNFFSKVHYRICSKGFLDQSWSERLNGMVITNHDDQGGPVVTLVGVANDQSALLGVLNSLYELHLPLLSVHVVSQRPVESRI